MFGKDDQLTTMAVGIEHLRMILQQPRQLFPFLVRSAATNSERQCFKPLQNLNFGLKFSNCSSRGRLIDDCLFGLLDLGIWGVIKLVDILIRKIRNLLKVDVLKLAAALEYLFLA